MRQGSNYTVQTEGMSCRLKRETQLSHVMIVAMTRSTSAFHVESRREVAALSFPGKPRITHWGDGRMAKK